ncbi:SRPBCC family protein [Streptomyces brevispora]|uniref:Polyketide cyclase/dehydrase/lipid transport protein n=1 Tax=Streptomyces brevispora TaxID=887462 RepID=A0A561URD4_9ACTN|nr:SRPBCC family protein [Streptomyces brevispora]TWG01923.1 polyketide cyclase/dehydrase/lipid transport protein [Streptomyces brevispora]WSC16878.1 SRPBCC family protein [Streptomyces brevispora]
MDWNHYRFMSVWDFVAPPGAVYQLLERAEQYPRWWPQVREVTPVDDTSGTTRIRSLIPYDLVITFRERRRDPLAGVLEVALTGDLEGWARWTVTRHGAGSRATYEQEVEVRKRLLRVLAVPGRPVFRANHALMMRAGRRGLAARLEAV